MELFDDLVRSFVFGSFVDSFRCWRFTVLPFFFDFFRRSLLLEPGIEIGDIRENVGKKETVQSI